MPLRAHFGDNHKTNSIIPLRRTIGDQATQRWPQSNPEEHNNMVAGAESLHFGLDFAWIRVSPPRAGASQDELAINEPVDEYEQEADCVAEEMMPKSERQMPTSAHLSAATLDAVRAAGNASLGEVLAGARSEPVGDQVRAATEQRLGQPLGDVRVHRSGGALEATDGRGALAFTNGRDIAIPDASPGRETRAGRSLLIGELAHVVQQRVSGVGARAALDTLDDGWERAGDASARGEHPAASTGAALAIQRETPPPHLARSFAGEQTMGFVQYPWEEGWAIVRGPGGSAGHAANAWGEDVLAYNVRTGILRIADNKSLARAGNVSSATAISDNLGQNVDEMIDVVEAMSPEKLPMRQDVLRLLRQTRAALRAGTPLPGRVDLVVHGEGGASTGVTARLQQIGIRFVASPTRTAPTEPPAPRAPLRGGPRPTITPEGQYEFPGMASRRARTAATAETSAAGAGKGAAATQAPRQLEFGLGGAAREAGALEAGAGAGLRARLAGAGRSLAGAVVLGAIIYGLGRLRDEQDRRKFAALEPQVDGRLRALQPHIQRLQAAAFPRTVWVQVTVHVGRTYTESLMAGTYEPFLHTVELRSVEASLNYSARTAHSRGPYVPAAVPAGMGFGAGTHEENDVITYSFPVAYEVAGRSQVDRAARIAENERDAARPDLPTAALEALFAEREALITTGGTR
jgi:hypothetical protein